MYINHNLTEIEVFGLHSLHNLSDGHSYFDTNIIYKDVIDSLPEIWSIAASTPIPKMENDFKSNFSKFYKLHGLLDYPYFSICPTASNSIDIIGAWAHETRCIVGLIEPTFDNLALLLKRREVSIESIPESYFHQIEQLEKEIKVKKLGALFIVNPNNPTGVRLSEENIKDIIYLCKRMNVTIIFDTTFRFSNPFPIDEYMLLQEAAVSFIILEDTGKFWPALDTKASLLVYSENNASLLRKIYEEIYLCSSNLSLAILSFMINKTYDIGGINFIHNFINERMNYVKESLSKTLVEVKNNNESIMSVAWLNIEKLNTTDLELVKYFRTHNLSVLPGRYFFWNSHHKNGHQFIRISLLKSYEKFVAAINILSLALAKYPSNIINMEKSC